MLDRADAEIALPSIFQTVNNRVSPTYRYVHIVTSKANHAEGDSLPR